MGHHLLRPRHLGELVEDKYAIAVKNDGKTVGKMVVSCTSQ